MTRAGDGRFEHINPWDMELDEDEARKRVDEARKQKQAVQRAARRGRWASAGAGSTCVAGQKDYCFAWG